MANRNKNYISDNERAGNNSNTFSNDPDKGINEAQTGEEFAKSSLADGEVVAKDAAIIAGTAATGGAGAAAAPAVAGGTAAGGAAAGAAAGGTVAAGGAAASAGGAAGATVAEGAGAAAVEGVAAEGAGGALGAAGESATTSGASDAALGNQADSASGLKSGTESASPTDKVSAEGLPEGDFKLAGDAENGISDGTSDVINSEASGDKDGLLKNEGTESSGDKTGSSDKPNVDKSEKNDKLKKNIEESLKNEDNKGSKQTIKEEKDFYKSKNFMDGKKRSERKRLAQQKIDDKGKDDRGVMERSKDKLDAKTGVSKLDATGDAIDTAGRAAGTALDAASGGKTKTRDTMGAMGSELTGAAGRLGNTTERQLTKFSKYALKVPAVGAAAAIMVPLLLLVSFAGFGVSVATTSAVSYAADGCNVEKQTNLGVGGAIADSAGGFSWAKLTDEKRSNATQIIKAAADRSLPPQAAVVALATAMQESGLIAVDHGDTAGPDSRGLFQQRDSWGSKADRMDPYKSANLFYDRLIKIVGWETLPVTTAAQKVQISAFPDAYAKHELDARNVLANAVTNTNPYASQLSGKEGWANGATEVVKDSDSCEENSGIALPTGTWVNPYCDGFPMTISNYFGPRGAIGGTSHGTASFHTGMDMYARGGGPNPNLCASTAGTVTQIGSSGGCGNMIVINTDDKLSFVYCHMKSAPSVKVGDHVETGQPIGQQGTTGNSSGEHLHFEVSTLGGQFTNAANPMCLFKTKPDFVAQMDFSRMTKYKPNFDYMCERRSDLDAWDKNNWG